MPEQTPSPIESMRTPLFIALLVAATLLGTGLRLYKLAEPSLWADEMFTIRDAVVTGGPGYRWTRLGLQLSGVEIDAIDPEAYDTFPAQGMNEWKMRIGSGVVGCLAIPLLAFLSARFLGRRTAVILALLLALDTWHLMWSQQARFYAPMFLYFSLALVLYYSATTGPRRPRSHVELVFAMIFAAAAVATKPTSNLVLAIIGADIASQWLRARRFPLPLSSLAILVVGGTACVGLTVQSFLGGEAAATTHFLARSAGSSPVRVGLGNVFLTGVPLAVLAGASAVMTLRHEPRLVTFLVASIALPMLAFMALAAVSHVEPRYTFISTYGWLALASLGLSWLWERTRPTLGWLAAAVPIALLLAGMAREALVYYESGYGNRARWRHAFEYVERNRAPGEQVIAHDKWAGQFYLQDPTVLSVILDACLPGTGSCLGKNPPLFESFSDLPSDTWFVVKGTAFEVGEGKAHWLDDKAEMRAVYPTRIPYPQMTVRVYYYRVGARNEDAEPGRDS